MRETVPPASTIVKHCSAELCRRGHVAFNVRKAATDQGPTDVFLDGHISTRQVFKTDGSTGVDDIGLCVICPYSHWSRTDHEWRLTQVFASA